MTLGELVDRYFDSEMERLILGDSPPPDPTDLDVLWVRDVEAAYQAELLEDKAVMGRILTDDLRKTHGIDLKVRLI